MREGTRKVLKIHRYEANVDDNNDRTLDFAGSNDLYIGDYDRYYTLSCNIKIIVKRKHIDDYCELEIHIPTDRKLFSF